MSIFEKRLTWGVWRYSMITWKLLAIVGIRITFYPQSMDSNKSSENFNFQKQARVNSRRNEKVAAYSKLNVLDRETKVEQKSGGRGTPGNSWWGSAAQFSKSWPYFRPKIVIFHTRFQTWPLKFIPVFRPGGGHKTQHHTRFT